MCADDHPLQAAERNEAEVEREVARRLNRQLNRRDAAISKLRDDANLVIEAVEARAKIEAEGLSRQFAAYQLHVAETFATKAGVTDAVGRVETAVSRLSERIDRLREMHAAPTTTSRSRRSS